MVEQNEAIVEQKAPEPDKPLHARHREVARLIALGKSSSEIAAAMDFTVSWVSVLRSNSKIQHEAERYRDRLFERTAAERLQELTPLAFSAFEHILTSDNPNIRMSVRLDAARWILEKTGGKPRQEIEVDGGATILQLLHALDAMKEQRAERHDPNPSDSSIDVTPPEKTNDPLADWVEKNVPGLSGPPDHLVKENKR